MAVAPAWSAPVSVVSCQKVAANAVVRGTLDISGKFGALLFIRAMRLSSSTPAAGIIIGVRRNPSGTPFGGAGTVAIRHPGWLWNAQDSVTASNLTTLNGTPTVPGLTVTLTSATGFAGNQLCAITDSTTTPTRFEVGHTTKIASTTLTFDSNITCTTIATGDTITNLAFVPAPIWIDGTAAASEIEVVFDNGLEGTIAYAVECWAQTLNNVG